MPDWFALTVKPHQERSAGRLLAEGGIESFVPLHRTRRTWCDRQVELECPLFPGYIFGRFGLPDRVRVLRTPGVSTIIGFGNQPAMVPSEQIAAVRALIHSGLPMETWPFLRAGRRAVIVRGPLRGLVGVVAREKDAWRVVVNVDLLQRSLAVALDRTWLSAIQ